MLILTCIIFLYLLIGVILSTVAHTLLDAQLASKETGNNLAHVQVFVETNTQSKFGKFLAKNKKTSFVFHVVAWPAMFFI